MANVKVVLKQTDKQTNKQTGQKQYAPRSYMRGGGIKILMLDLILIFNTKVFYLGVSSRSKLFVIWPIVSSTLNDFETP